MGAQVVAPGTVEAGARNSYADLLRTIAILGVVLGHWLVTAVVYRDGHLTGVDVLGVLPWTSWLTLLLQVVPLFFLVGGFANAVSWERQISGRSADGGQWANWVRRRALRLLMPAAGYVIVIALAVVGCEITHVDAGDLSQAAWGVALHLWFLAAYGILLVCTPILFAAHRRWSWRVPVVMAVLAVVIDAAVIELHWRLVGWANYLLVWGVFHQLGFAWHDGTFASWRRPAGLALVSSVTLAGLIWWGPYPVSMVGVPGARIQNASPPSSALLAFGLAQSGVVLTFEPAVRGWLVRHRRAQAVTGVAGAFTMPVYLWHMVPVVLVAVVAYPGHLFSQPRIGSGTWWVQRVAWVVALAIVLVVVLAVLALVVRLGHLVYRRGRGPVPITPVSITPVPMMLVPAGVVVSAVGLGRLAVNGFAPGGRLDPAPLVALAIGTLLLHVAARPGLRVRSVGADSWHEPYLQHRDEDVRERSDTQGIDDGAGADRAAHEESDDQHGDFDHGAHHSDRMAARGEAGHQTVARSGTESGTDVTTGRQAVECYRRNQDDDAQRERMWRRYVRQHHVHDCPDREDVRDGAESRPLP